MHLELAPPPAQGLGRSLGMALVVHVLLLMALTWGINWPTDSTPAVEAELWSALPRLKDCRMCLHQKCQPSQLIPSFHRWQLRIRWPLHWLRLWGLCQRQ